MTPTPTLRSLLRRDILIPCVIIFLCDIVWNMIAPTLSLYAKSLGASLPFIGTLNSVTGLAMLIVSVPVGALSDRVGRKRVLTFGSLIFAASGVLHALSPTPEWLLLARVLFAIGTVTTFPIGATYVVDVTSPRERGLAFGILTTSMSLGATCGALLAALLARLLAP